MPEWFDLPWRLQGSSTTVGAEPSQPIDGHLWLDLDDDAGGDVPEIGLGDLSARVDSLEQAPPAHAGSHDAAGTDPLTPDQIGAAAAGHSHDLSGYAPVGHTHSLASLDAAAASHGHAAADITSGTFAIARLPVGTGAGTVAAGNDARLSDARTPTAHTHGAADITPRAVVTASGTGAYTVNADAGTDWYLTATGNRTLTVSGGYDGQMIVVDVLASGGARTITLSGVTMTGTLTAALPIPSGKVGTIGLRRTNGTWRCLAQTTDA